jgi:hypothetical protein
MTADGRSATFVADRPRSTGLYFGLLIHLQRVIRLNAEVAHCAFEVLDDRHMRESKS